MYQLLVLFAAHRLDKTPPVQFAFRQTVLLTTSGLGTCRWMLAACSIEGVRQQSQVPIQSATMSVSPVRIGTA
jgi:hypothetical protein